MNQAESPKTSRARIAKAAFLGSSALILVATALAKVSLTFVVLIFGAGNVFALETQSVESVNPNTNRDWSILFHAEVPTIDSLVFSKKLSANPAVPQSIKVGLDNSTNVQWYYCKRQTNAFCVRAIRKPEDLTQFDSNVIYGPMLSQYENKCWFIDPRRQKLVFWQETNRNLTNRRPTVITPNFVKGERDWFRRDLNFLFSGGIFNADLSDIRYASNHFSAYVPALRQSISGALQYGTAGVLTGLTASYKRSTNMVVYQVSLSYSTNKLAPSSFPSAIHAYQLLQGRRLEREAFHIQKVITGATAQPEAAYDLSHYADLNGFQQQVYTNGALYDRDPLGILHLATYEMQYEEKRHRASFLFYGGALIGSLLLLFLVRDKIKQKQNQQTRNAI